MGGASAVSVLCAMLPAVGINRAARLLEAQASLTAAQALPSVDVSRPNQVGILSPWQTGMLSAIVWSDVFGTDDLAMVTRATAMTVPAVVKARQIICGQLSGLPLRAMRGAEVLPDAQQPTWMYSTAGAVSPYHRMMWTLDDLIFVGWSLWWVTRGAENAILTADRVPLDEWEFTPDGVIKVYGSAVRPDQVILFPGPTEGLLTYAARTIRAYRNTEDAWQRRVRNPVPVTELHQNTDDTLTPEEVSDYLDAYSLARRNPDGAVTFTPNFIDLNVHGENGDGELLIGARNALRVDIANFVGLPAAALDGSVAASSLTYVTQEGKFSELGESLRGWMEPVEARLSQDDVVPRGQRTRYDATDRLAVAPSPTGPEVLD